MNLRPVRKRVSRSILLAALGQYVEVAVDPHELLTAAAERAVRVEDLAFRVLIKHAMSRKGIGLRPNLLLAEVIDRLSRLHLLRLERHMEIIVEIGFVRRHPTELPSHPLSH